MNESVIIHNNNRVSIPISSIDHHEFRLEDIEFGKWAAFRRWMVLKDGQEFASYETVMMTIKGRSLSSYLKHLASGFIL